MGLIKLFSRHLYLRIWLTVVIVIILLILFISYIWQVAEKNYINSENNNREIIIYDKKKDIIFRGSFQRVRHEEEGIRFIIKENEIEEYILEMTPYYNKQNRSYHKNYLDIRFWLRKSFGFSWIIIIIALVIICATFPIINRLLKRLNNLQNTVKLFGNGELSIRAKENGCDEVADLSKQFNITANRIENLINSQKSLLANASHELRTPLTRISIALELLNNKNQKFDLIKREIKNNIDELDELINIILLSSRLEAQEIYLYDFKNTDIIGLLAEECSYFEADLDIKINKSLEVKIIAKLVRHAIRNLLENAKRYGNGEIKVSLSKNKDLILIKVEDNGLGVFKEEQEKVFEKFYRSTKENKIKGFGLGLSLVKSIAKIHDGNAYYENRQNSQEGACFVFTFKSKIIN